MKQVYGNLSFSHLSLSPPPTIYVPITLELEDIELKKQLNLQSRVSTGTHEHTHMCCWTADRQLCLIIISNSNGTLAFPFSAALIYYRIIFMNVADFFLCFSCSNDLWLLLIICLCKLNGCRKCLLHTVPLNKHFNSDDADWFQYVNLIVYFEPWLWESSFVETSDANHQVTWCHVPKNGDLTMKSLDGGQRVVFKTLLIKLPN